MFFEYKKCTSYFFYVNASPFALTSRHASSFFHPVLSIYVHSFWMVVNLRENFKLIKFQVNIYNPKYFLFICETLKFPNVTTSKSDSNRITTKNFKDEIYIFASQDLIFWSTSHFHSFSLKSCFWSPKRCIKRKLSE